MQRAGAETEETYPVSDFRDARINDKSTQDELRKIYWDHGYESANLTFRHAGPNRWVANEPLRRRQVKVYEEGSSGSGAGNVFGPPGGGKSTDEKGDEGNKNHSPREPTKGGSPPSGERNEHGHPQDKVGGVTGGKRDDKSGESKDGGGDGTESSLLDELLGDAAALASLLIDPDSLYEAKQGAKKGEKGKGAQIGSKSGFLRGRLAQLLAIGLAFGEYFIRLFKALGGFFGKSFRALTGLLGSAERKALTKGVELGVARAAAKTFIPEGEGIIALVAKDGELLEKEWITGSASHPSLVTKYSKGKGPLPEGYLGITILKEGGQIHVHLSPNVGPRRAGVAPPDILAAMRKKYH
jgi:hypothetical protein